MPSESEIAESVAQRYRAQGYAVRQSVEMAATDSRWVVDLLAEKGDEQRLIEIQYPGRPRQRGLYDQIRTYTRSHPSAHYDLVVTGPTRAVPHEIIGDPALEVRIEQSRHLVQTGALDAALLLGCSAFEAAARRKLAEVSRDLPSDVGSGVLRSAAREGIVDPDEADAIGRLFAARNEVAHGGTATLDSNAVERLLDVSSRLAKVRAA